MAEVIEHLIMLSRTEHEISTAHKKLNYRKFKKKVLFYNICVCAGRCVNQRNRDVHACHLYINLAISKDTPRISIYNSAPPHL